MNKTKLISTLLLSGAISISAVSPMVFAATNAQPKLVLNNNEITLKQPIEIRKGVSYLPLRSLTEQMSFKVLYNNTQNKIELVQPNIKITFVIGIKEAEVNGKKVKMSDAPFTQKGVTYIPLRFVSEVMNSNIKWDRISKKITITDNKNLKLFVDGENSIWLSTVSGQTWIYKKGNIIELAKANIKEFVNPEITMKPINDNSYMLDIDDEYASQLTFFHNKEQFLVNGVTVTKQTSQSYQGTYNSYEFGIDDSFNKNYLSDGNMIYVIGPDGKVLVEYNLEDLSGQEGPFIIEYFRDNLLFIRSYKSLQLTLVDLEKNTSDLLYKSLLNKEEQKYWDEALGDTSDNLYRTSLLKLTKYNGRTFDFSYLSTVNGEKKTISYTYK